MICKKRGCRTIISRVANSEDYCFLHQRQMVEKEAREFYLEEDKKKYKKGWQVSNFLPIEQSLEHFKNNLRKVKTKIKYKIVNGKECHSIFRYS